MAEKSATKNKLMQFRVEPQWLQEVDDTVGKVRTIQENALDRSTFVRDIVSLENAFLRRSPYICKKARHFVLVTKEGEFFYRRGEALRLNNDVDWIPGTLTMKAEKRDYFIEHKPAAEIRKLWMLNHFALWEGAGMEGRLVDSKPDKKGVGAKMVKLKCGLPGGAVVFREGVFVLDEYAQWYEPRSEGNLYDRVDIVIDVPTRDLEIIVVVDRKLYRKTSRFGGDDFNPELKFELRNREEVPFASKHSFERILRDRFLNRISASFPSNKPEDDFYAETRQRIESSLSEFKLRLAELVQKPEALGSAPAAERIGRVQIPSRYMFYRVQWSWAHIGVYLSIKWVKPESPK